MLSKTLQKTPQQLPQELHPQQLPQELKGVPAAGDTAAGVLRAEAIVEPAVWIPDFPGDEPDTEYAHWRDLLFVYSGAGEGRALDTGG